jgi:hypothetical protein
MMQMQTSDGAASCGISIIDLHELAASSSVGMKYPRWSNSLRDDKKNFRNTSDRMESFVATIDLLASLMVLPGL